MARRRKPKRDYSKSSGFFQRPEKKPKDIQKEENPRGSVISSSTKRNSFDK